MVEALGILADQPELVALGTLAGVAPSRMAAAFNDADHFFDHLTLGELDRIQGACARMAQFQQQMTTAFDQYLTAAQEILANLPEEAAVAD